MGILFYPEEGEVLQHDDVHLDSSEHFEGVEKRLQVEFLRSSDCYGDDSSKGLRSLSRHDIEQVLSAARCSIVRKLSNDEVDTYVLSESSLFVYSHKVIIKTCGTTKLLNAVPVLLDLASRLSLRVKGCKYSRATYDLPEKQPFPHGSFCDEVDFLNGFFGKLGSGSKAYVLNDPSGPQSWHIYSSYVNFDDGLDGEAVVYTLEMCMTQLSRKKAAKFFKAICNSAAEMTRESGIGKLLPNSEICDFAFDPCGYSMNSVERGAVSTIHVTPEKKHSYASFETMGYDPQDVDLSALVSDTLGCFQPGVFSVAVHVSGLSDANLLKGGNSWLSPVSIYGYTCTSTNVELLPGDGAIMFQTYKEDSSSLLHTSVIPLKGSDSSNLWSVDKNIDIALSEVEQIFCDINPVFIGKSPKDVDETVKNWIIKSKTEEAFYVMDVGVVLQLWKTWKVSMPRVHPFYAVKCNSDRVLLSLLSALGAGFDVASKAELDLVQSLGVGSDRIIFANPCKLPSHVLHAASQGVHLTTFDSESELRKLHKLNAEAEVVLRIRVCDPGARCPLGVKYGAEMDECEGLLTVAKTLGLQVVGVAFHVGSGASDAASFASGIYQARQVFDMAKSLGITSLRLLDVGGGFVSDGGHGVSFEAAAKSINEALDMYFPCSMGVSVIAEPGRFFAEETYTLAAQVFGSRVRRGSAGELVEYWINDGIYGSMNCLLYDHAILSVRPLCITSNSDSDRNEDDNGKCCSTIFGPTCDGLDTIMEGVSLPRMNCGDWLVFSRMGAYTKAAASTFNGFDISGMKTVCVCSI